ncbi:MAG: hypothetical protein Q4G04_01825 [bacterium]|nr:hypothetical protein [bacterium]
MRPRNFTLSAFLVGFLLIDNLTSSEQNAMGSWFMLVGQTLCTNSSKHFVAEGKMQTKTFSSRDSDFTKNMLTKTRDAIDKQLSDMD